MVGRSGNLRFAAPVAWFLSLVAYVLSVALAMTNRQGDEAYGELAAVAVQNLSFVAIATLALLILRSRPKNKVAWAMMLVGVMFPLEAFFAEFTEYGIAAWGEVGLTLFASWVSRWIWIGATLSIPLILLYYPDGNLPSVRWRPVVPLIWGVVIITFFFSAVDPTPMEEFTRSMPNPFAVETPAWLTPIVGVVFWGLALLPVLGAISLIPRYRRSEGVERQQMKLIAWVGAVAVVYLLILRAVLETSPVADAISNTVFTLYVGAALTAGIVRYRVFEIDRIISRSISYTAVVIMLAAVFASGVVVIPNALGIEDSPLLVAASTLAVAGLFNPVRKRVQRAVDKRFNRSRYQADQVVDEFAGRLQHSQTKEQLADIWIEAVDRHFEPAMSGIWLKPDDT